MGEDDKDDKEKEEMRDLSKERMSLYTPTE